jgi:hypothetical protein
MLGISGSFSALSEVMPKCGYARRKAALARSVLPGGKNRDDRASNLYQLCIAVMSPV